jgi:PAS domain S-box-containing protein
MNPLAKNLLCPPHIEYLVVDQDFNIVETSLGLQRFSDIPHKVRKGNKVFVSFPELIGIENILIAILQGQQISFELKGIGRFSDDRDPLYIDLYIIKNPYKEALRNMLIIFLEDVTERMVLEQKLVQKVNESSLLLEAWDYSSNYLDKIITSMGDALLVTTSASIIKIINQATKDLLGYSEEELIGKPISNIISEENLLREASKQYLLSHKVLNNVEVLCQTKTGEKRAIAFSCSAIQTDIEDLQDFIYVGRAIAPR